MPEAKVGIITHYFGKIGVAVLKATDGELSVGDTIHVKGSLTDFSQTVDSMQVEHAQIDKLERGQEAGVKLKEKVHEHDEVFRVLP